MPVFVSHSSIISQFALASVAPSGENANAQADLLSLPVSVVLCAPVFVSHKWILLFESPPASVAPSGEKAIDEIDSIDSSVSVRTAFNCLVRVSHNRSSLPGPSLASVNPSGEKTIWPKCVSSESIGFDFKVSMSHSRISRPLLASIAPSGENASTAVDVCSASVTFS